MNAYLSNLKYVSLKSLILIWWNVFLGWGDEINWMKFDDAVELSEQT